MRDGEWSRQSLVRNTKNENMAAAGAAAAAGLDRMFELLIRFGAGRRERESNTISIIKSCVVRRASIGIGPTVLFLYCKFVNIYLREDNVSVWYKVKGGYRGIEEERRWGF